MRNGTKTGKRVSLELGGHAPLIICGDVVIPAAVQQVMASKSALVLAPPIGGA